MYTHRGAALNALGEILAHKLERDSVFLWTLPLFHCNGWCFPWAVTAAGGSHVMVRSFDPAKVLDRIAKEMVALLPKEVDALAGLEMGGIPLAVMLSRHTGLPARFVRKKAKEYGTCNLAEGGPVDGLKLVVVEDVVTSGGQIRASVSDLRERGAVQYLPILIFVRRLDILSH